MFEHCGANCRTACNSAGAKQSSAIWKLADRSLSQRQVVLSDSTYHRRYAHQCSTSLACGFSERHHTMSIHLVCKHVAPRSYGSKISASREGLMAATSPPTSNTTIFDALCILREPGLSQPDLWCPVANSPTESFLAVENRSDDHAATA